MDTETQNTLAYGQSASVPGNAAAAWGARMIFPNDVVWDRTDMFGERADKDALLDWLNESAPKPTDESFLAPVRAHLYEQDVVFTIFEDGTGKMVGRVAGGYTYVAAWLTPKESA